MPSRAGGMMSCSSVSCERCSVGSNPRMDSISSPKNSKRAGAASEGGHTSRIPRSEEHTSELQSRLHLVCRLLLEKKYIYFANSVSRSARNATQAGLVTVYFP